MRQSGSLAAHVLDTLYDSFEKGSQLSLVCSNETYSYFKDYRKLGIEVLNEGDNAGTGGFLSHIGIFDLPDSFYIMNGNPLLDAISIGFLCGYIDARKQT